MSREQQLAGDTPNSFQRLVRVTLHVAGIIDDMAKDAVLVDDVRDAANHAAFFIPRAERLGRLMVRVAAHEPVAQATMLCEGSLAWNQINA